MSVGGVIRRANKRGYFTEEDRESLNKIDNPYNGLSILYLNSLIGVPSSKLRMRFIKHNPDVFDKERYKLWESFVKDNKKGSVYLTKYWELLKGVSNEEALILVDNYKKDKVTSLEGFIKRYGDIEGKIMFEKFQETSSISFKNKKTNGFDFRKNSRWCVEYWMEYEGKSRDEAENCVSKWQKENAGVFKNIYLKNGLSDEETSSILENINSKKGNFFNQEYHKAKGLSCEEIEHVISDKISRVKETFVEKGLCVPEECRLAFMRYKDKVYKLTNSKDLSSLNNIDKRGREFGYEVDHIYSLLAGFLNNVPIEVISCIGNLRCIPAKDNNVKGQKCEMELEDLYRLYEEELKGEI